MRIQINQKRNKYNAKKWTSSDGIEFDSREECRRWEELRIRQRIGEISNLQRQVKYELIPNQRKNGKVVERSCDYIADFVYQEKGQLIVEDVKGYREGGAYRIFAIKRKLMLFVHGIEVKEWPEKKKKGKM